MTPRLAGYLALVLAGSLLTAPLVVLLGVGGLALELVGLASASRGIGGLEYRRRLLRDRTMCGDEIPLELEVRNRRRLPVAWVEATDVASDGVVVRERPLGGSDDGRLALVNGWSLRPRERVVRRLHIVAERRGAFAIGPTELRAGDVFGRPAGEAILPQVDRYLVRPRLVAVRGRVLDQRSLGDLRARRGLLEDPALFAGVRAYQPGDPMRRIHWKATARIGRPLTRLHDPSREREVVLAIDIQTVTGIDWRSAYVDDLVEGLCVAAASLARALTREGVAVGVAASAYGEAARPFVFLAPSEAGGQIARVLDLLARLGPFPALHFEELLTGLVRSLRPGTTIQVLTARDPGPYLAALRRAAGLGFGVELMTFGPGSATLAGRARRVGIRARSARLDGTWRTSRTLVLAR